MALPKSAEELRALSDAGLSALRASLDEQADKLRALRMAVARECEDRVTRPKPDAAHNITGAGGIESQEG